MRHNKAGKPRGILNYRLGKEKFYHNRFLPQKDLEFFIEHYWTVFWNLGEDESFTSETLPHPSVHLVFEKDYTRIVGVMKGKFTRLLEGKGKVFGIKFKPGAFYPFVKKNISSFTNKFIDPLLVFDFNIKHVEKKILATDDEEKMIEIAEEFLLKILPEEDETVLLINEIAGLIISEKTILKVDDIIGRININKRTLQRIFNQYVGVSPKWMIKRYRLHEAAELLADGKEKNLTKIALNLGYFDQAHFIKDFKSIIGKTPAEYLKENRPEAKTRANN